MESSNRQRQTSEAQLLETMYPTEFSWRKPPSPDLASETLDTDAYFTLTLHPSYTLEFTLPVTYPSDSKPQVYLSCGGHVDTATRKHARSKLAEILDDQETGLEVLDLIVTSFQDLLSDLTATKPVEESVATKTTSNPVNIKRVVIWSHHLLATSKRRDIQAWSRELRLGGFSRPGHPGAVFAEGDEDQVDEFVRRLKQLRWQALQVRGEDTSNKRLCGPGDGIIEVEGLGEIAESLKKMDPDSADLFLQGMKIAKTE